MAIDPMLYRKVSGKSGNPHDKLGQALASSSGRKQKREIAGGEGGSPALLGLKVQWWFSIIASIAVLIVLFMMMM